MFVLFYIEEDIQSASQQTDGRLKELPLTSHGFAEVERSGASVYVRVETTQEQVIESPENERLHLLRETDSL